MKQLVVTDFGIFPSPEVCCADALARLLADCPDDCEMLFPAGVYFLTHRVVVANKKGITLRGDGAIFRAHFCNTEVTGLDGSFHFQDCQDVALENFTFDLDVSPNIAGRISRIDADAGTFEIHIFDEFAITGQERLEAINTVDLAYTPDYRFVTYDVVEHEYLGGNSFRFHADKVGADLSKLYEGLLVNIRHIRYGAPVCTFANVDRCLIQDITITAASGCAFVIGPRSSDFTFRRFHIRLPENTQRLMASNADGIHVLGLTGSLVMEDCHFENLGDDALNIHSKAAVVTGFKPGELEFKAVRMVAVNDPASHMLSGKKLETTTFPMHPLWVRVGDPIYVYDRETVGKLGELVVTGLDGCNMTYDLVSGSVKEGDILANGAYFAATRISGCSVKNTRARGFLLQTNNVIIEDCHIYGMSMSAFLLSPDVAYWFEVGPCSNVVIRNNLIEKCTNCIHRNNTGAIVIKCRHEEGVSDTPAGTHNNIHILNNTFRNIGDSAIFALAVRDLEIRGNRYENCSNMPFDEDVESLHYDVALVNCDRVTLKDNTSDREEAFSLYRKGVTNFL